MIGDRRIAAIVLALTLVVSPAARATGVHNMVRAALVYGPQTPHVGDVWHVSATLESADGLVHPGRRVRVIGEMTGHPMRAVESDMTRSDEAGRLFSGQLAFTMRGPWRITIHVEDVNEQLVGTFPLEVAKDDEPAGATEMRTVVWIVPPPQPNVIPPIWAAIGTVALTIAFEIVAAAYHRRRLRRAVAAARAAIA